MRRRLAVVDGARRRVKSSRALTSTKAIVAPRRNHEIDLAARDGEAARQDRDSPCAAAERGDRFGAQAKEMGAPPRRRRPRGLSAAPPGEAQRPRIDFAARQSDFGRHRRGRVLQREACERREDQRIERVRLDPSRRQRRSDHDDDLALAARRRRRNRRRARRAFRGASPRAAWSARARPPPVARRAPAARSASAPASRPGNS